MNSYLLASCVIITVIALLEIVARYSSISLALMRKLVHMGIAITIVLLALFVPYKIFIPLGILFAIGMVALRFVLPLASLADRSKQSYGEIFFPLGVAVAALLAHSSPVFICSIAILGFSDTLAYAAGKTIRSPKMVFGKTLAGSLTLLVTSAIFVSFIEPLPVALLIGMILSITELYSPGGSDNVTLPSMATICLLVAS